MAVSRNSESSPGSKAPLRLLAFLAALSAAAIAYFYAQGSLLYYGDATAHLNIARSILDTRTPGWRQFGTVWLPLPHLLMLPFARSDWLWQTGLAGAIPSGLCFVAAGLLVFLAARRAFSSGEAGVAACLLLALNPNLLYLQSIAMSEAAFLATLAALLYFTVRFRERQGFGWVIAAGLAACAGSLARYEGWFLIPFVALCFLVAAGRRRWLAALVFAAIAGLGPLAWLAHNWWYSGNAFDFYNGPYSAQAIYKLALDRGLARYPGDHEWTKAWLYFRTAVQLCAGWPLVWLGAAGAVAALLKKVFWPLALLALPPVFYICSMYSSGTPIFVPQLWPFSYYNTRYGLAALPLLALAAGALVAVAPARFRRLAALLVVLAGISGWLAFPRQAGWICWKESQVNSVARRAWTGQAADFLRVEYRAGDGVLFFFGDLAGVFQQAGIPLRETLHQGNEPLWWGAVARPDLFLWEKWAVAVAGDPVSLAMGRAKKSGPRYDCVKTITVQGAPAIEIYRRFR
ncbi:MAG: glycosyltransferase family 39 protein [Bryobacteraceae bacterium]